MKAGIVGLWDGDEEAPNGYLHLIGIIARISKLCSSNRQLSPGCSIQ